MADRPVFLYAGIYDDIGDAEVDYEAVFDLHAAGLVGTFDTAGIERDEDNVRVHKTEKPTPARRLDGDRRRRGRGDSLPAVHHRRGDRRWRRGQRCGAPVARHVTW